MTSTASRYTGRSPITIAAGFVGAFVVGSLAVQLVRMHTATATPTADVEPVVASPATLWSTLAEQDSVAGDAAALRANAPVQPAAVVASEATLWSAFAER